MLYLLDANVLIDADRDYYTIHRVPQFWEWLLEQAEANRVKIPLEIYEEALDGRGDLPDWLKENKAVMLLDESVDPVLVQSVLAKYARDLTDEEVDKVGGDPFLIAYGLARPERRCVVTNETSKPSRQRANRKIPDVCDDLSIHHCDTFELLRLLDFRIE